MLQQGSPRSSVFRRIHENAISLGGTLETVYREFREDEQQNFWNRLEDLEDFLSDPLAIDAYISGIHGANQILKYRSIAVFELLEDIVDVPLNAMRAELNNRNVLDSLLNQYLDELREVMIARKSRITEVEESAILSVNFDFAAIQERKYLVDPREFVLSEATEISVFHTEHQQQNLVNYFSQYGSSLEGLSYFIQRQPARMLYRQIKDLKRDNPPKHQFSN